MKALDKIKKCIDCGNDFSFYGRSRCEVCQKKYKKEYHHNYWLGTHKDIIRTISCIVCGKLVKKEGPYQKTCKECRKQHRKEVLREWKRNKRKTDKTWSRRNELKEKYGITIETYEAMKIAQSNRCAICGIDQAKSPKILSVDHSHSTGKVRGLLCSKCNLALGNFQDSTSNLITALEYLRKFK